MDNRKFRRQMKRRDPRLPNSDPMLVRVVCVPEEYKVENRDSTRTPEGPEPRQRENMMNGITNRIENNGYYVNLLMLHMS